MKDQGKVKETSDTLQLQSEKGMNILQIQLKTMISNLSNVEVSKSFELTQLSTWQVPIAYSTDNFTVHVCYVYNSTCVN